VKGNLDRGKIINLKKTKREKVNEIDTKKILMKIYFFYQNVKKMNVVEIGGVY